MWLKFSDGTCMKLAQGQLEEMTVLAQSLLAQPASVPTQVSQPAIAEQSQLSTETSVEVEIDLSQAVIAGVGHISQSDIEIMISANFANSRFEQLLSYILICNYLGWDNKLPLLYERLAKRLCSNASLEDNTAAIICKMTKPITVDGHDSEYHLENDMYSQTNSGVFLTSDSFKLLWLWRHHVFGPPTKHEKLKLQLHWWLLNCDPKLADEVLNTDTDADSDVNFSAVLAKILTGDDALHLKAAVTLFGQLEAENVTEILLRCWIPVYFGGDSHHERRWSQLNDDVVSITPMIKSAEHDIAIFTNPAFNRSFLIKTEILNYIAAVTPQTVSTADIVADITDKLENTLVRLCLCQEPRIKICCLTLVWSWCNVVMTNSNTSVVIGIDTIVDTTDGTLYPVCVPQPQVVRREDGKRLLITNIGSHNRDSVLLQGQCADFDVNLYMCRLETELNSKYQFKYESKVREFLMIDETESLAIRSYTDIIDIVQEGITPMLHLIASDFICFPLPHCYNSISTMMKEMITTDPKIRQPKTRSKEENSSIKQLLLLKSDSQLKDLCRDYNILIVNYEKELTIKVLSNYYDVGGIS